MDGIPGSITGAIEEIFMFNKEGSSGIDVKVPSTYDHEILTWVNACTEEVQTCLQIAAINTVILTENHSNETSEGSGEPAAQKVTLKAKGNFEHEQPPNQGTVWSIVPCSRDLPEMTQSKKTAWLAKHVGKRYRTGTVPWRNYIGSIQKESPDTVKGLTPYQVLGKLTSQTQEGYEVSWKEGSPTTGQQLYQEIRTNLNEKNLCTSELYNGTQARIWVFRRFHASLWILKT